MKKAQCLTSTAKRKRNILQLDERGRGIRKSSNLRYFVYIVIYNFSSIDIKMSRSISHQTNLIKIMSMCLHDVTVLRSTSYFA